MPSAGTQGGSARGLTTFFPAAYHPCVLKRGAAANRSVRVAEVLSQTDDQMVFGAPRATRKAYEAFGALLLAMGLAWPTYLIAQWARVRFRFKKTEGVIVASLNSVLLRGRGGELALPAAVPRVRYEYAAGGRRFRSARVAPGLADVGESVARRFPRGMRVDVYYNPRNPREAYLAAFLPEAAGMDARRRLCWAVIAFLLAGGFLLLRAGLWPDELALDFARRTYRLQRGRLAGTRVTEGSFDDFKGLRFRREARGAGRSTQNIVAVYLRWHTGEEFNLGWWLDHDEARAALVDLLVKLDLPIIDPATGRAVISAPDSLIPTLREQADRDRAAGLMTSQLPSLPPKLGIRYRMDGDAWRFRLPPFLRGHTRAATAIIFLGVFLLLETSSPRGEAGAQRLRLIVETICLAAAASAVLFGGLREEVVADPDKIEAAMLNLGRRFRVRSIPCSEIKGIWFDGIQVLVRSEDEILHIDSAARARPGDKRWLVEVLRAVVTASRPGRRGAPLKLPTQPPA